MTADVVRVPALGFRVAPDSGEVPPQSAGATSLESEVMQSADAQSTQTTEDSDNVKR
jgi:hypothetical protein